MEEAEERKPVRKVCPAPGMPRGGSGQGEEGGEDLSSW